MIPDFMEKLAELTILDEFHRRAYLAEPSRWYWRETVRFLQEHIPKGASILDAGCGFATLGIELHRLGYSNYWGIDSDGQKIYIAKRLYREMGLDPDRLRFGSIYKRWGWWDAIICMEVLYDLSFPESVLKSIHSNLKPGGYFIFSIIAYEKEPKDWRIYIMPEHVEWLLKEMKLIEMRHRSSAYDMNVWYAACRE